MRARLIVIKKVKDYREKNNLTQEELSLKLNKKKDFITRLEDNKLSRALTIDLIDQIAKILNVSIQQLMEDEWI